MQSLPLQPNRVCAVVLAGGRATRMAGADKGLQTLHGKSLAAVAIQRLQAQSGGSPGLIALNANRHQAEYGALQVPVWSDTMPDFAGPLAGMLSAMQRCQAGFDFLLSVPCDTPRFPLDLLQRLSAGLCATQADIAMVLAPDTAPHSEPVLRRQPVFCLMRSRLAPDLADYLRAGGRKAGAWAERHTLALIPFDAANDNPQAFANINTLDELQRWESQ